MHLEMDDMEARAWMLWSPYDWKWTILWLGHGCSGNRVQLEMDAIMGWAWRLWWPYAIRKWDDFVAWAWMHWRYERARVAGAAEQNKGLGVYSL